MPSHSYPIGAESEGWTSTIAHVRARGGSHQTRVTETRASEGMSARTLVQRILNWHDCVGTRKQTSSSDRTRPAAGTGGKHKIAQQRHHRTPLGTSETEPPRESALQIISEVGRGVAEQRADVDLLRTRRFWLRFGRIPMPRERGSPVLGRHETSGQLGGFASGRLLRVVAEECVSR